MRGGISGVVKMTSFEEYLHIGRAGEDILKDWLQQSGAYVIETRDMMKTDQKHKGPSMWGLNDSYVLPDFEAIKKGNLIFVEAKTKSTISNHLKSRKQQHGIDTRHYIHYLEVNKLSGIDVWVVILEIPDPQKIALCDYRPNPRITAITEPIMLCANLDELNIDHPWESDADAFDRFGNDYKAMVYFNRDVLHPISYLQKRLNKLNKPRIKLTYDTGEQQTLFSVDWVGAIGGIEA